MSEPTDERWSIDSAAEWHRTNFHVFATRWGFARVAVYAGSTEVEIIANGLLHRRTFGREFNQRWLRRLALQFAESAISRQEPENDYSGIDPSPLDKLFEPESQRGGSDE